MPIFKELRPYLEAAWNEATADVKETKISDMPLITRYCAGTTNLRTQLCRIITKAGLTPWEMPFQNLCSTRETELAEEYPLHIVCAWIGNREAVGRRHYLQVTDAHITRAIGRTESSVVQNCGAAYDCN